MSITPPANVLIRAEYIVQEIEEALVAINGKGNYHTKVNLITRDAMTLSETAGKTPVIMIRTGSDDVLNDEAGFTIQRTLTVLLRAVVRPKLTTTIDTTLNDLKEDIMRCIKADKQRQSLALWTRFGRITTDQGEATPAGVLDIEINIPYFYHDSAT